MKVISQITPWPIMQAVKAQTRKYRKGKEKTGQLGIGENKQGEGILRDDTKTYRKEEKERKYKEKTEGGKVWKGNTWRKESQSPHEINKVSGFLYKKFKKPGNSDSLRVCKPINQNPWGNRTVERLKHQALKRTNHKLKYNIKSKLSQRQLTLS